jgi:hypothetical protein
MTDDKCRWGFRFHNPDLKSIHLKSLSYFCTAMFKYASEYGFHVFNHYEFLGLHIGDPITAASNLLLFVVGVWCSRRVAKAGRTIDGKTISPEMSAGLRGWQFFFLISAFAYLCGVPVHGFSYYFSHDAHFWMWITMGWIQMFAVAFVQFGTAKQYFPSHLKWTRVLIIVQFIFFGALMVWIKRFGAVNTDIALGLIPIAILNICLYRKGKAASYLMGAGILFAAIPAIIVAFKWMPAPWLSYNDMAHFLLIISLLIICRGIIKNLEIKN